MAIASTHVTEAFVLSSTPFKESDCLCELWTLKLGRIRCHMRSSAPEPYRQIELKLSEKNDYFSASDFRYIQPLLIENNHARLLGFYINELIYKLMPLNMADQSLYGRYISTLLYLNQGDVDQQILRFWEQGVLASLGRAVDYQSQFDMQTIEVNQAYNYEVERGFVPSPAGRYSGEQILSVARQDYKVAGALALARECQRRQMGALLEGQVLETWNWPMAFLFKDSVGDR